MINVLFVPYEHIFFVLKFYVYESMSFKVIFRDRPYFYHQALAFQTKARVDD
ncbi:MAG: hypothetical protein AB7I27_15270 [Bacteriovoracaceae bacterium]